VPHASASRLESLLESAQLLHASLELDDLLSHLLRTVMGRLLVTRAVIAIDEGDGLVVAMARGLPDCKPGKPFDDDLAHAKGLTEQLVIGEDPPVGKLAFMPPRTRPIDEAERTFLSALLGIAATGIANARAHRDATRANLELDRKIQQLHTLVELGRAFARTNDPDDVVRMLALTLAGQWLARRHIVAACSGGHAEVRRQVGVTMPPVADLLPALQQLPEAVCVEDIADERLRTLFETQQVAVVFVLRSAEQVCGLAALGRRPAGQPYDAADLEMGAGLAAQGAVALENCWLFREALTKREMDKELDVAASIQQGLFPAELPPLRAYDLAAMNRPAQQVGGDYYDAVRAGGDGDARFLLCVADVSGKGLSASLLMSTLQATLRALFTRKVSLSELAEASNDLLFVTTPGNKYATAALVLTDGSSGWCQYLGAGHTETLLVRADGAAEWLGATGVPLGLFPDMTWVERKIHLDPGDTLVLYSDGVTEAQTEGWDEFDPGRLEDVVRQTRDATSAETVNHIVTAIDRFVGGAPQFDDITLMVLKRRH
jgi:phosphoserine phosphatase RsbU/P